VIGADIYPTEQYDFLKFISNSDFSTNALHSLSSIAELRWF